jgi:hypothetical protein
MYHFEASVKGMYLHFFTEVEGKSFCFNDFSCHANEFCVTTQTEQKLVHSCPSRTLGSSLALCCASEHIGKFR